MIILRVLVTLTLLCVGLILPWWICVIGIGIACFVFPWYLEGIVIAGLLDSWFGAHALVAWPYFYMTLALCWYSIIPLIRQRLFIDA